MSLGCTIISHRSSLVRWICTTCAGWPFCCIICTVPLPVWTSWHICPVCSCAAVKCDWIGVVVATICPAALMICALCSCPFVMIICCGWWCCAVVVVICCVCWAWCWLWLMSLCRWRDATCGSFLIIWCGWISICAIGSSTMTVMPLMYSRNSSSDFSTRDLNAWHRLTWCTHWMHILSGQPSVSSNWLEQKK